MSNTLSLDSDIAPELPQHALSLFALEGLPDFKPGMDLAQIIIETLAQRHLSLQDKDILVIAHKVVSKCEGAVLQLSNIIPRPKAVDIATRLRKDPRKVEVILRQSRRIVRQIKHPEQHEGVIIAEHKLGFICANAAVDESNVGQPDQVITLPENPDASAKQICHRLEKAFGCQLGLVISDTFGRPWRMGQTNVAIGVCNIPVIKEMLSQSDAWGRPLKVTAPAFADELAAASGLLMDKAIKCPVLVFRGLQWKPQSSSHITQLIRPQDKDLFR
jgi:coenzyme F420-0:L-glutamate ligase/coenzyme F420-1:gamma-L-glutamate ligase